MKIVTPEKRDICVCAEWVDKRNSETDNTICAYKLTAMFFAWFNVDDSLGWSNEKRALSRFACGALLAHTRRTQNRYVVFASTSFQNVNTKCAHSFLHMELYVGNGRDTFRFFRLVLRKCSYHFPRGSTWKADGEYSVLTFRNSLRKHHGEFVGVMTYEYNYGGDGIV